MREVKIVSLFPLRSETDRVRSRICISLREGEGFVESEMMMGWGSKAIARRCSLSSVHHPMLSTNLDV